MKNIDQTLSKVLQKHRNGAVIMLELPAEQYFGASINSIKFLTRKGFAGLYVSFQRPYPNLVSMFREAKINAKKILVVHACPMPGESPDPKCTCVPLDANIDDFVKAIYTSLEKIKNRKKFVFIDSLTTIALYKQLSEFMRFSEFLIRQVRKQDSEQIILLFNVAKDFAQKKFIKDIALKTDEVIVV